MPSWTLADLMSQATTRAGRRDDIAKSDVSFWVNASYQEVAQLTEYALQERIAVSSTTSGEYRVDLPTDFHALLNLSIWTTDAGSGRTLTQTNINQIDESGFYPLGTPQRYTIYANWLELHPSPDSGYSLQMRYLSMTTDLTAETDVPSLETAWRKAILYLTEAELWAYSDNPEQEAIARQRYYNYVNSLENLHARRQKNRDGMRVYPIYPEVRPTSKRSFDVV